MAASFAILLWTRTFVGIGEAGYGPAAPTILSDLYPLERRGRTLAYFTSRASSADQTMGTVHLDVSTVPSVSGVFNIAANMLPGDFQHSAAEINADDPVAAQRS